MVSHSSSNSARSGSDTVRGAPLVRLMIFDFLSFPTPFLAGYQRYVPFHSLYVGTDLRVRVCRTGSATDRPLS